MDNNEQILFVYLVKKLKKIQENLTGLTLFNIRIFGYRHYEFGK